VKDTPVARLPFAARAYLAGVCISILVLIALHFSIQTWSQQQAQQWVAAWEKQYGGHVGEVRLHMLRGALSIHEVQWQSAKNSTEVEAEEGVEFYAPFVLLRGNVSTSIQQVEIREVTLQGASLVVSEQLAKQMVIQQLPLKSWLPWAGVLDHIRLVQGKELDLIVRGDSEAQSVSPFNIKHVKFSSTMERQWNVAGELWGGRIDIQQNADDMSVRWSDLNAKAVSGYLGLSAFDGKLSGTGTWKNHQDQQQLSGNMHWLAEQKDRSDDQYVYEKDVITEGSLLFHGSSDKASWQGDIQAENWPLQSFSELAPILRERKLTTGYLQGLVQVKSDGEGWQASVKEGGIHDLAYQGKSNANWYMQELTLEKALLSWPQRSLNIKAINITKARWAVDSYSEHIEGDSLKQPSAENPIWRMKLPNIQFSDMQLGDVAKNIWLTELQGHASLIGNALQIDASTASDITGKWNFKSQGRIKNKHDIKGFNLSLQVQASEVPLRYFRDALPQDLVQGASLNGKVDLQLDGLWNHQGWQLQGDVNGKSLMWNRAAWLWQIEKAQLKDVSFGSMQAPHIKNLKIQRWSAKTSLKPWSQTGSVNSSAMQDSLALDGWEIEHATMARGIFSLGQAEAVWLEADLISLDGLQENQDVGVRLRGKLAEGAFSLDGTWFPWGKAPWIEMHASLKHALPFSAAPWLKISGLPAFSRGRISADLEVKHVEQVPYHYQGLMQLTLTHGKLQDGVFNNQTLSDATGYTAHALFDRITQEGDLSLQIPLQGNWVNKPLNGEVLGQALLKVLAEKGTEEVKSNHKETVLPLPNIRLHDSHEGRSDTLKHNERVRLRKALHLLQAEKGWHIELIPELGQAVLDESLFYRVRQTQKQIEIFLVDRGISPARIFPIWPDETSRQGESTGILIQAAKP